MGSTNWTVNCLAIALSWLKLAKQSPLGSGFVLITCFTLASCVLALYAQDPFLNASGSTVACSGVQWLKLQISTDNTSLSLADYGRIFDSSGSNNPWWYYFPSIMVNRAGEMVAGFSGSTKTNYMSALYSWRLSNGASNLPTVYQAGTYLTSSRAGDYSATTLDPTDDCTFWTVQEYGNSFLGGAAWGTAITKIRPSP